MNHRISGLTVRNFRTLTDTKLPLGPLTVMVGPNAAGKSNVLQAIEFLRDVSGRGIERALDARGGFDVLAFRGGRKPVSRITVGIEGVWSDFASEAAPDRYELSVSRARLPEGSRERYSMFRREHFTAHPVRDTETAVQLGGSSLLVLSPLGDEDGAGGTGVGRMASALHQEVLLPMPEGSPSAGAVAAFRRHLSEIRVFDPDVRAARRPSPISTSGRHLAEDASNLADFLKALRDVRDGEGRRVVWEALLNDVREVVPQLHDIHIVPAPGRPDYLSVELEETGLRGRTRLQDASFGTVRILCLLAIFHDPDPPVLTCIEEIDHGIHPHALERLAGRLRAASRRAQFLVTTHSPVFVDELKPEEFVVCERRSNGASVIPALTADEVRQAREASEGMPLGELWFANTLGGGL
ncbi:AAA family ATPase [Streptomyces johnsoniae]|uniref:AAA family ATPase n=1 Tax=Streptomyces johnsoniae TaxID=3075532 RepID=A0ABU2S1J2_9ACTN|nr:AAA family ATPase [Streptomyces sp. DSM 41886]MDT0442866.1 AAA family ATPase [Streptomyces sp. DSM 41886]